MIRLSRSARLAAAVASEFARPNRIAAAAALAAFAVAGTAQAQSTASQLEEIVVTASRVNDLNGLLVTENAAKARSSITQEFIDTQAVGQNIVQTLNLTPGLNYTNNDAFGSSGGNIRLRGFDGNRVSLTFDGIPLNDTGNYAVFTNQQLDAELIERANVNLGTTDVDSPTASATGGTINYITSKPTEKAGAQLTVAGGSDNYKRIFLRGDTGEVGPWGTRMFLAGSYQNYDKFKGPGELEKKQFNFRIYQPIGDDDFVSLSAHWNRNRNNNYRTGTKANWAQFGRNWDFDATCNRPSFPGTNGVADNDGSTTVGANGLTPAGCDNFYGRQVNPSNTGNIRGQSSFGLGKGFRFTFDPSLQYTLADGGTQSQQMSERDGRVRGNTTVVGKDLNGDGDTLDTVRLFWPSLTNTYRVGVTSSLIWDLNEQQRFRVAYTYDRGRHRQTGAAGPLLPDGSPENVFGGREGQDVLSADNVPLRSRDRYSIAELQQVALEYRGKYFDDALTVSAGIRMPRFTRKLNQYCYSQNGSTNVLCTTQLPSTTLASGNVQFAGSTTQYISPYSRELKFNGNLPNVGLTYRLTDNQSVFASYAQGFSAPRTDNLYTVTRLANGTFSNPLVQPETTRSFDLGYRYDGGGFLASASIWKTRFTNRIVSSFDDVLGVFVDRNVGRVDGQGFDGQIGWQVVNSVRLYASASYNDSVVKANIPTSLTQSLPTSGKLLVETPKWTFGGRVDWDVFAHFTAGLQGKYVSKRWSTDVNDEYAPSYASFDLDARYDFGQFGYENLSVQLNVTNLLDRDYFGSISSRNTALGVPGTSASLPTYNISPPRTVQVAFKAKF
jgi:iron complex outermembrane receptor protein